MLVDSINSVATVTRMGDSSVASDVVAAEAAELKRLFLSRRNDGVTQEQFGQAHGIGSQGMVWQYLNGRRPLNLKAAAAFAQGLGCSVRDFSPRLHAL